MTTVIATGALMVTGGVATAPAALADGPDTPDEVIAEIEALEWPEYGLGDEDPDISVAGWLLVNLGYLPTSYELPNDEFTEELEDAVLEFQGDGDIDLPETGRLDQETWDNLRKRNYGIPVQLGDTGERVFAVQYNLNEDYGYDLAVDGIYGPNTQSAVIEMQEEFGIDPDGLVGVITFRALVAGGV
ncbi:peptidoglycan-binding domain-containing protein [Halostreptopolyspora alba]